MKVVGSLHEHCYSMIILIVQEIAREAWDVPHPAQVRCR
jgi:hypothetical protein